jgi:hypothetical protein
VLRRAFLPGFADEVPLVLVDVLIAGTSDVRLIGRLLDGPDATVRVGDRVSIAFEEVGNAMAVPAFTLGST